jgi:ligand-binding SRPBCC domain-containing protein
MALFQLFKTQIFSAAPETVWAFISNPHNLRAITPDYLSFTIRTKNLPGTIYPGLIIHYTIKPVLGLKLEWITEISQVVENSYFIDKQIRGPYALWVHEHRIEQRGNGTIMTDLVSYDPGFGFLSTLANALFIRRKLEEIFDFRQRILAKKLDPGAVTEPN